MSGSIVVAQSRKGTSRGFNSLRRSRALTPHRVVALVQQFPDTHICVTGEKAARVHPVYA